MANFQTIGKSLKAFDFNQVIRLYFSEKRVQDEIIRTLKKRLFAQGLKKDNKAIKTDKRKGTDPNFYKLLNASRKKGGTAKGLGSYKTNTEIVKSAGLGLSGSTITTTGKRPINRVTLQGSGSLYDSMKTVVSKSQLSLVANFDNRKYYKYTNLGMFHNFQNSFANKTEFRETVMSLTNAEIENLIEKLIQEIITEMKNKI